jgi:hypothetical protein
MVEGVLALAMTWPAWDDQPRTRTDAPFVDTPHKAIRRVADHLVEHLAEVEARLADVATLPDHWRGSAVTTVADSIVYAESVGDLIDPADDRARH